MVVILSRQCVLNLQIQNNKQAECNFMSNVGTTTYIAYSIHIRCVKKNESTEFQNIRFKNEC